ncbi:hypothetical protein ABPG72_007822 [Tetrahymena utriculariae]
MPISGQSSNFSLVTPKRIFIMKLLRGNKKLCSQVFSRSQKVSEKSTLNSRIESLVIRNTGAAKVRVQVFLVRIDDAFSPSRGYHLAFNIVRNQQSSYRSFQQEFGFQAEPKDQNFHFFLSYSSLLDKSRSQQNGKKELETV